MLFSRSALTVLLTLSFSGLACEEAGPGQPEAPPAPSGRSVAVFAGGCFWCMEGPFEALDGVDEVVSGYTGGEERNPTYDDVGHGRTGHAEAVRIVYDPSVVSYERLLEVFWHNIDPTQASGQFCDRGRQYRTAVFVQDQEQRAAAVASRRSVDERLPADVVTEVVDAGPFWVAEDYHQNYHRTNPVRYRRYRIACGRDARLLELWGDDAGH